MVILIINYMLNQEKCEIIQAITKLKGKIWLAINLASPKEKSLFGIIDRNLISLAKQINKL